MLIINSNSAQNKYVGLSSKDPYFESHDTNLVINLHNLYILNLRKYYSIIVSFTKLILVGLNRLYILKLIIIINFL